MTAVVFGSLEIALLDEIMADAGVTRRLGFHIAKVRDR